MNYIKTQKHTRGFTLIEMLVSIALFAVTVTISMGSLLVLVDANAKSQSVQIAVTNLSFALDTMTRQLRTGTDIYCATNRNSVTTGAPPGTLRSGNRNCGTGETLAFTDSRTGWRYAYTLNGSSIQRKVDDNTARGEWQNITGQNIRITDLDFEVSGSSDADLAQPTVTIYVSAEVGDIAGFGTTLEVQTSVTQRQLDL